MDRPVPTDSDEGTVELFAHKGKVHFRALGEKGAGTPLLRQAENIYAIDENSEVRFLIRDGRATWGVLCAGGLMMDPTRRVR